MKDQATPRPWKLIDTEIIDSDNNRIAQCISRNPDINEEANAKLICKAVNERDELIEALDNMTIIVNAYRIQNKNTTLWLESDQSNFDKAKQVLNYAQGGQ